MDPSYHLSPTQSRSIALLESRNNFNIRLLQKDFVSIFIASLMANASVESFPPTMFKRSDFYFLSLFAKSLVMPNFLTFHFDLPTLNFIIQLVEPPIFSACASL